VALSIQKGPQGGQIGLLRADKKKDLLDQKSWELFAGLDGAGNPLWTQDRKAARPVFTDPRGVGPAVSGIYVKALGRFLLMTEHDLSFRTILGIFEARDPWGPFKTAYYDNLGKGPGIPDDVFFYNFVPPTIADGKTFTLAFTGKRKSDSLNLLDGSFTLDPAAR
jgi:hypothetical protein